MNQKLKVPVEQVVAGDMCIVRPGEKIPCRRTTYS